jgi:CHRD domain
MRKLFILGLGGVALVGPGCQDNRSPSGPTDFEIDVYRVEANNAADFFRARPLNNRQEVPPVVVPTDATGRANFRLLDNGTLRYNLFVEDIEDILQAHIHIGPRGVAGPVVVFLFPSVDATGPLPPERAVTIEGRRRLRAGTIRDENVRAVDDFPGGVAALVREMRRQNAYVNVHTIANPPGEIRGHITPQH